MVQPIYPGQDSPGRLLSLWRRKADFVMADEFLSSAVFGERHCGMYFYYQGLAAGEGIFTFKCLWRVLFSYDMGGKIQIYSWIFCALAASCWGRAC